MAIQINLSNKTAYTLIAIALVLVIGGVVIAFDYVNIPNPGHGADTIQVSVDGVEENLQQFLEDISEKVCIWKLSNPKDSDHGNFPWLPLNLQDIKPTGICICSDGETIDNILANPAFVGYLDSYPYPNPVYTICDSDNAPGCTKDYFVYLSC